MAAYSKWQALFRPSEDRVYFNKSPLPPFDPEAADFSRGNAWWLSEISRLIYRRHPDEAGGNAQMTREAILARVGLRETHFFNTGRSQAAIISTPRAAEQPFSILVYRGTAGGINNWYYNFQARLARWPAGGKVHSGFKRMFFESWERIASALPGIAGPIYYTGHSLGAALATLAASVKPPSALYTFGSPCVGDADFAATLNNTPVFRITTHRDIVTSLPPMGAFFGYRHAGRQFDLHAGANQGPALPSGGTAKKIWRRRPRLLDDPPAFLYDHAPIQYSESTGKI